MSVIIWIYLKPWLKEGNPPPKKQNKNKNKFFSGPNKLPHATDENLMDRFIYLFFNIEKWLSK